MPDLAIRPALRPALRSTLRSALTKGVGVPAWAQGTDLATDYTLDRDYYATLGRFPPGTDTHAASIYALNAAGVYAPFAANVPVRTDLGLQTVPSRTNSIRNNSMQGAVVSGALPNNWFIGNARGLTISVTQITTQNGIDTIRISISGTPSSTGRVGLFLDAATTQAVVQNNVVSESIWLALATGSLTNFGPIALQVDEYTSGSVYLTSTAGSAIVPTATLQRYSRQLTIASATAAWAQPVIDFEVTNGLAVAAQFDIGWPQLELGAFASPPIRTTSAAATVNGNQQVIDLTGKLGSGAQILFRTNVIGAVVAGARLLEINDATANNSATLYASGGNFVWELFAAGVSQGSVSLGAWATGDQTFGLVVSPNFIQGQKVGGSLPSPDTSATYPTMTKLNLGGQGFQANNNNYQLETKLAFKNSASDATSFTALMAKAAVMAAS